MNGVWDRVWSRFDTNLVLGSDSYKGAHWKMEPSGTEIVFSYFESRGGAKYKETILQGLQYIIRRYLAGVVITAEMVQEAKAFHVGHFGSAEHFNEAGWMHIVNEHGGMLPLRIKAVPEGLPVPTSNVLLTIENTDKKVPWLTNFVETLVTHVWSASTVATMSRDIKQGFRKYLEDTSENQDGIDFMLHDFGFRGASSLESAALCGSGHLVNFKGTDTMPAIRLLMNYYESGICGVSVPASEHSIMTSYGREGEADLIGELLEKFPTGVLSLVCDSYNIFDVAENVIGGRYLEQIKARDGVVVVRPDSGDPVPTVLRLLDILSDKFGCTVNSKGFKVLPPCIRVIWGDGLVPDKIFEILEAAKQAGYSSENLVFGMGGSLLQRIDRDIQRFAFKCSWQLRDDVGYDIYKEPLDKSKASKRGRMKLVCIDGVYDTVPEEAEGEDILQLVFENGYVFNVQTFDEIRERAKV